MQQNYPKSGLRSPIPLSTSTTATLCVYPKHTCTLDFVKKSASNATLPVPTTLSFYSSPVDPFSPTTHIFYITQGISARYHDESCLLGDSHVLFQLTCDRFYQLIWLQTQVWIHAFPKKTDTDSHNRNLIPFCILLIDKSLG